MLKQGTTWIFKIDSIQNSWIIEINEFIKKLLRTVYTKKQIWIQCTSWTRKYINLVTDSINLSTYSTKSDSLSKFVFEELK